MENIRRNSSVSRVFPPADHPARQNGVVVFFALAHLRRQLAAVVQGLRQRVDHQHHIFQRLFSTQILGALGVIPDIRVFGQARDFFQAFLLARVVKDTSGSRRCGRRDQSVNVDLVEDFSFDHGCASCCAAQNKSSRQVYPTRRWGGPVCWPKKNHPSDRRLAMSGEFYIYKRNKSGWAKKSPMRRHRERFSSWRCCVTLPYLFAVCARLFRIAAWFLPS